MYDDMSNVYWLFAGKDYYPEGGFSDLHNSYLDIEEAKDDAVELYEIDCIDWAYIFDFNLFETVAIEGIPTMAPGYSGDKNAANITLTLFNKMPRFSTIDAERNGTPLLKREGDDEG